MKFTYALIPIATLCSVIAHGERPYGATPVSFTEDGIKNAIHVGIKSPEGNASESVGQTIEFFKRNPKVVESAMAEVEKDEHSEAKNQAIKLFMEMYNAEGGLDLYEAKLKAITYAYEHPEFLELVQKVIFRVKKDNPTLVDDLFETAEKVVEKDPGLVAAIKEHVLNLAEENEKVYKEIVEMVLKTALIEPAWAANVFVHILRVERIGCSGTSESCDCNGGQGAIENEGNSGDAPSETEASEETPEPTPITDASVPGDYEEEEDSAEGAGELAPEVQGEGEAETEPEAEAETPTAETGSYARPSPPKPLDYARPE